MFAFFLLFALLIHFVIRVPCGVKEEEFLFVRIIIMLMKKMVNYQQIQKFKTTLISKRGQLMFLIFSFWQFYCFVFFGIFRWEFRCFSRHFLKESFQCLIFIDQPGGNCVNFDCDYSIISYFLGELKLRNLHDLCATHFNERISSFFGSSNVS